MGAYETAAPGGILADDPETAAYGTTTGAYQPYAEVAGAESPGAPCPSDSLGIPTTGGGVGVGYWDPPATDAAGQPLGPGAFANPYELELMRRDEDEAAELRADARRARDLALRCGATDPRWAAELMAEAGRTRREAQALERRAAAHKLRAVGYVEAY